MKQQLKSVFFLLFSATLMNCGGKKEEAKNETRSGLDAIQQFAEKAKELENKEPVDPVDFRKLKELLPEKAGGFSRKESNGEKSGMGGFNISRAEGKYEKEGESFIDVEILDTGGIGGFALAGLAAWTIAKVDKETETGYEKSTTIEGYKAFEQYDNQSKDGQLHLLVGDRYILNVSGNNVSMDQMKALLTDLSLDKLADLK